MSVVMDDATRDAECERLSELAERLSDAELVEMMIGLHARFAGAPMYGGHSEQAALATRCVFTEIASRWIPPDVFGEAFPNVFRDDDDVEGDES
jgi:hypothetical protein